MLRERQAHCCADPHLDMPFSLHSKCASAYTWREEVETRNSNACGTAILPSWNSRRDEPCALVYVGLVIAPTTLVRCRHRDPGPCHRWFRRLACTSRRQASGLASLSVSL